MISNINNIIIVVISSVTIIVCSVGIIIASRFQNKQRKRYNEVKNIIKEKEDSIFKVKDGLSKEDINYIDNEVDIDNLMRELYNIYLELENKVKMLDTNFDDILTGNLKDYYVTKVENFKQREFAEVIDGIELISYSITEYSKENLKFRIVINCYSYKRVLNEIVSGSNLEKVEQILLLGFTKVENKWLINSYERLYEKKIG